MPDELIAEDEDLGLDSQYDNLPDEGDSPARLNLDPKEIEKRFEETQADFKRQLEESEQRSKREIEAAKREAAEAKRSQEFWSRNQQPPRQEQPQPKVDPEKFMEEFESKGPDALKGHFATTADVERIVEQRVAKQLIQREIDSVYETYPDLKQEDSEFSKKVIDRVRTRYQDFLGDDPIKAAKAMRLAAEDIDEMSKASERDRSTRAGFASAGRSSSGASSPGGTGRQEVLTPSQKQMAANYGISEKAYLESLNQIRKEQKGAR